MRMSADQNAAKIVFLILIVVHFYLTALQRAGDSRPRAAGKGFSPLSPAEDDGWKDEWMTDGFIQGLFFTCGSCAALSRTLLSPVSAQALPSPCILGG